MSNKEPVKFMSRVGRYLFGDLYETEKTKFNGDPLDPLKDGSPHPGFWKIAIGIAKNPGETHFSLTPEGKLIWETGYRDHGDAASAASFSWKVIDGDSNIPGKPFKGKPGRAPKDVPGYAGNWIFIFKTYANQALPLRGPSGEMRPDLEKKGGIEPGDWVQVYASVEGNDGESPGVYLNPLAVSFQGYHRDGRFTKGIGDTTQLGFGQGPKPAALVDTPVGMAPGTPAAPTAPPPPQQQTVPQVPVAPSANFVKPGNATVAGAPPPPPPPPQSGPKMTALAKGQTYAAFIAGGWTDAQLKANGYME
jgi:hypothetical protein